MDIIKHFIRACLALVAFVLIAHAEHYQSLNTVLKDEKNSVIEAFSFMCGACYTHHKLGTMARVKEKLPQLEYKIYPLKSIQFGEEFAKLYAYAEAKDKAKKLDSTMKNSLTHKLADAYFVAVFERKQNWQNSQSFLELGLKTLNISKAQLDQFISSAEGKELYANYDKAYNIASQYGGTPAFAVGGKYFIIMKDIQSLDEFIDTIKSLSQK